MRVASECRFRAYSYVSGNLSGGLAPRVCPETPIGGVLGSIARTLASVAGPHLELLALFEDTAGTLNPGFGTKIHLRAEGNGKPIALLITAGQRHKQGMFEALMETGTAKRPARGRPRIRPDRVAGDR